MSTLILVATGSVSGVIGAAAMVIPAKWLRDAAKTYNEAGDAAFDRAEHLAEEVERTRNMPWHYADEHVTGELVAVETHETPALSAESHEDEQAADEDTDRPGAGAWLLATLIRLCEDAYDRIAEAWQSWRTRDDESDAEAFAVEVAAMREAEMQRRGEEADDLHRQGLDEVAAAFEAEASAIVEVEGRKRVRGIYRPTCEMPLVVPDPGKISGRHRITVPAQRDGEVAA